MSTTHRHFKFSSAVHVFLLRDGEVLLLRRANTGYKDGMFSVPAGHLDGNESVVDAAIREAREEVGVAIAAEDVVVVAVMHRAAEHTDDDEYIDFFVAIEQWQGEVENCEADKCAELLWSDLNRLPEPMILYIRKALDNYQSNRWFDSFGHFESAGRANCSVVSDRCMSEGAR